MMLSQLKRQIMKIYNKYIWKDRKIIFREILLENAKDLLKYLYKKNPLHDTQTDKNEIPITPKHQNYGNQGPLPL